MGTGSHGQSLETTIAQVVADELGVDIDDVTLVQGDTAATPLRAGHRRQPERGDRQRRRRAGARDSARRGCWPSPPRCSRPRPSDLAMADSRISVAGDAGHRALAGRGGRGRLPRPGRAAAGHARRARGAARYQAPMINFVQRAPTPAPCEVDPATGAVRDPPLRRERGLRRDDQPDGRRGPDRGRRRPGHRRRALRAHALRRRRQPAGHDLRRLPAADGRRGPRPSSTATSRRPRRHPAATRAWARAAPSRSPAALANAVRDALAPLGVRVTTQPLTPDRVVGLIDRAPEGVRRCACAGG